jgi:hypothetical protein
MDEARMSIHTTSCKEGMGDDSAKICAKDCIHKERMAKGEKAPFCCCRYLRTQVERMR